MIHAVYLQARTPSQPKNKLVHIHHPKETTTPMPSYDPRKMEPCVLRLLSRGFYIWESICAAVSRPSISPQRADVSELGCA